MVIVTDLGHTQKMCKHAENTTVLHKTLQCLLCVVFHNIESQNAGRVDVKKDLNWKKIKGLFCAQKSKKQASSLKCNWV